MTNSDTVTRQGGSHRRRLCSKGSRGDKKARRAGDWRRRHDKGSRYGAGDADPANVCTARRTGVPSKVRKKGSSTGKRHRRGEIRRRPSECDGVPGRTIRLASGDVAVPVKKDVVPAVSMPSWRRDAVPAKETPPQRNLTPFRQKECRPGEMKSSRRNSTPYRRNIRPPGEMTPSRRRFRLCFGENKHCHNKWTTQPWRRTKVSSDAASQVVRNSPGKRKKPD